MTNASPISLPSFRNLLFAAGLPGFLLLLKPIIYVVFERGRADEDAYTQVDFTALVIIFHAFWCLWAGINYFSRKINRQFLWRILYDTPLKWFGYYMILSLVSTIWSVVPSLSAYRAIECIAIFLITVAAVHNVLQRYNFAMLVEWVLFFLTLTICVRVIQRICYHAPFQFILMSSQMFATIFFYLALYNGKRFFTKWVAIVFSVFSYSTTSYIGMTLGAFSLFWHKKNRLLTVFMVFIVMPGILISIDYLGVDTVLKNTIFSQRQEISWEATSGRDRIWELVWNTFAENPLTGYGFFAGEPYTFRENGVGAAIANAHNSFSSAALGTGFLGVIFMGLLFLGYWCLIFSHRIDAQYKSAMIGCFCVGFVHSMANPGIGSRVFGTWEAMVLLLILISTLAVISPEKISEKFES